MKTFSNFLREIFECSYKRMFKKIVREEKYVMYTPKIVSSWSSLRVMCSEIILRLSMALILTSSISSLNMSTKKSRERFAKSGLFRANWHSDSTAADLTSTKTGYVKDILFKNKLNLKIRLLSHAQMLRKHHCS